MQKRPCYCFLIIFGFTSTTFVQKNLNKNFFSRNRDEFFFPAHNFFKRRGCLASELILLDFSLERLREREEIVGERERGRGE